jgi:O-acetyl-ADP-ribose deacetylase (regulator of RNase III)
LIARSANRAAWILSRHSGRPSRIDALELLDEERRALIRRNEDWLDRYVSAASRWGAQWPRVSKEIAGLPLAEAHEIMVRAAAEHLPCEP